MNKIRFGELPTLAQVGIGMTLMNSWVIFEETIIDRSEMWRSMPFYQKGNFCAWDLTAAVAIVLFLALAARSKTRGEPSGEVRVSR